LSNGLLTQVESRPGAWAVQPDPRYLRAQSEIYFDLARQMSLPADAQVFRLTAEDYKARAAALEARSNGPAVTEPEA